MKRRVWSILLSIVMVLLLCNVHSTKVYAATKIPSDALKYGNHYYYVYTSSNTVTWTEAKKKCKSVGGHLATLTSKKENDAVWNYISDKGVTCAWIGLYNSGSNSKPVWAWENGEKVSYTNWLSGQPSRSYNKTENYVGFWDENGWNDYKNSSTAMYSYICEWSYSINVSESTVVLDKGESDAIDATVKLAGSTVSNPRLTYKSNKTSVAKVTSNGKIDAVGPGICKITISYKKVTKKITVIVSPNKVSGVNAEAATKSSITLSWKAQKGVSGYQVWMYDPDLEEYVKVKNVSKDLSSATIEGLQTGTTYKFKVRAYIKNDSKKYDGKCSKVYKAKTK